MIDARKTPPEENPDRKEPPAEGREAMEEEPAEAESGGKNETAEETLAEYVDMLRSSPLCAQLPEEMTGRLAGALRVLGTDVQEAFRLSMSLANGDLHESASGRNILAGPLKDLQASLRHITWLVKQVEKGNYRQQTVFLDEFSTAFNSMVEQLEARRNANREQIERQVRYYDALEETHREWRSIVHDMKNHLLCIDTLLEAGDIFGAQTYIEKLREQADYVGREFIHTGNRVLDALLMDKVFIAKGIGVQVSQELAIGRTMKLEDVDCCTLFGNALDNAIEACLRMKQNQRRIILRLKLTGNMLHVDIENTSPPPLVKEGGFFRTSKADKRRHGMGMHNMGKVIEAYDGVWSAGFDNGWFRLKCLLCGV